MKSSPLYRVFVSLNPKERREIKKWTRSPAFNKRNDVIRLFDLLAQNAPESPLLSNKKAIFKMVFPNSNYEDEKLRMTQFFLLKLIKTYLAQRETQATEGDQLLQLCRVYNKKGLDRLFEQEWKKAMSRQQKQTFRNADFHHRNFQLQQERLDITLRTKRSDAVDVRNGMQQLKVYYLSETLRMSCSMLSQQQLSQKNYDFKEAEEVIDIIEGGEYLSLPAIALYYHGYQLLRHPNTDTAFDTFKQALLQHWQQFPIKECRDLYLMAINHCIRQLNRGHKAYIREAFQLYRSGLQQGVFLDDNQLSKFTYNNILTLAIGLSEWQWAADFLEDYKIYLPEKERQNIYEYNLAIYYYRKPDYPKALQLLRQVEFNDTLYNLNSRSMLARIYFELEEFDALDSLLDSFNAYLRRHKQLGYHRENYTNFILFLRRMLRANLHQSSTRQQLHQQLDSISSIAERNWLKAQLKG